MEIDFREQDIKMLGAEGIEGDWVISWETQLAKEARKCKDENQRDWHLSRLSFLAGYK